MLTVPVGSNSWVFSRATLSWAASVLSGTGSASQAQKDMKSDAHLWGKIAILFHWLSIPFYFQFILIKMGLQLKLDNHLSHTAS